MFDRDVVKCHEEVLLLLTLLAILCIVRNCHNAFEKYTVLYNVNKHRMDMNAYWKALHRK